MPLNFPDIATYKSNLENDIDAIKKLEIITPASLKIQSLLTITAFVLATRFLEGSIKHLIYGYCQIRGDNSSALKTLDSDLKQFNNPEFVNIRDLFLKHLNFDITKSLGLKYTQTDITFLNEIVNNRHRNVHASFDPAEWYNKNIKSMSDFENYYPGMINILNYLDNLKYDTVSKNFLD